MRAQPLGAPRSWGHRSTWAVLPAKSRVGRAFLLVRLLQTPWETCLGEVCRALPSTPLPLGGSTVCPGELPLLLLLHHHVGAGGSTQPFLSQGEPKLSAQMKAVSAECLGPPLDVSTKNITKSLASLVEIKEDGVGFSVRDPYYRDKVSRTISLPTRGSTL